MYLVVIAILSIVLTISRPLYGWVTQPAAVYAAVAIATLLPAAVAAVVTQRVLHKLDAYLEEPSRGQAVYGRGTLYCQGLLVVLHGALLLCTNWLVVVGDLPIVGRWIAVPGMLALIPFLLSVVLVWLALYPADRAVRQIALEVYLFRGRPTRPVWSVGQYLLYKLRHEVLFILIPMLLILAASDAAANYAEPIRAATGLPYAPDLLVGLSAVTVAIFAPEILRRVWLTTPLEDSPLRDRLEFLARRLGLRFREILVWRSGGMVINAAIMGVVPPLRYVLITDAMMEELNETKIEAVFGHEAGHARHYHIPCFLLFALISGCIVTLFSIYTRGVMGTNPPLYQMLATGLGIVLALKWGVVFCLISRSFERQADICGVRTLAMLGLPCRQPCRLHDDPAGDVERGPLCSTAAHVFGQALNDVAVLNNMRPDAWSWRHDSIASRSRRLQLLASDPPRERRFQRMITSVQWLVVLVAVGMSAWAAHALGIFRAVLERF